MSVEMMYSFVDPDFDRSLLISEDKMVEILYANIQEAIKPHLETKNTERFHLPTKKLYTNIPIIDDWQFVPHSLVNRVYNRIYVELQTHHIKFIMEGCNSGSTCYLIFDVSQ